MFKNLDKNGIALILLNARLTKKTFNRWMQIKDFTETIFKTIKMSYPQNLETTSFLKQLNIKNIKHLGNLKFAENKQSSKSKLSKNLINQIKNKKIWVATSTHFKEEIFCAEAHLELKRKIKNLMTIIIPRHVHRANEILRELNDLNLKVEIHSSGKKNLKNTDIYIVDTFGETQLFQSIASSVFLGGSIIQRGGQNPLEAARYGAKILHGPNIQNFKDIYKQLKILKISKKITSPKKLASSIVFTKNKNKGTNIKNIGTKILKKTINELDDIINNELKKT